MGALEDCAGKGVVDAPTTATVIQQRGAVSAMDLGLRNGFAALRAPQPVRMQNFQQFVMALLLVQQLMGRKHQHLRSPEVYLRRSGSSSIYMVVFTRFGT